MDEASRHRSTSVSHAKYTPFLEPCGRGGFRLQCSLELPIEKEKVKTVLSAMASTIAPTTETNPGAEAIKAATLAHVGLSMLDPETAALHLCNYFGFQMLGKDEAIKRYIVMRKGGLPVELNGAKAVSSQHLGLAFASRTTALSGFDSLPVEIVLDHENVRAREMKKNGNRKHGMIRFSTTSGLNFEFQWGDTQLAHDN